MRRDPVIELRARRQAALDVVLIETRVQTPRFIRRVAELAHETSCQFRALADGADAASLQILDFMAEWGIR